MSVCDFFYWEYLQTIFITSCVFFQWLDYVISFTTFTFFSNNDLLILPISGLQGFISRHVGLFLKFSSWSLRILKDSLSASVLMRSAKSSEHVWKLKKQKNINFNIKWEVVKKVKPFAPSDKVCEL